MTAYRVPLTDARRQLAASASPFVQVFAHGTMRVELYAPEGHDPQTPHAQDELYVVIAGRGRYRCNDAVSDFGPGDVLFAPAGAVHRFEDFSEDFAVWVVFYGPDGGEAGR
jgi:mannose-6-phosphate isomerase-like protein (cupin superfamily)